MGSRTSNVITPDSVMLQGFAGSHFDPSFRTKGEDSPVQRHRHKVRKNKPLKYRNPGETEKFQREVVQSLLGLTEVVRKEGDKWVLYDDETNTQIGSYTSRAAAWDNQRVHRKQKKYEPGRKKKKKTKDGEFPRSIKHAHTDRPTTKTKAQVPQASSAPKVSKVKGIKPIKPISPLKPIRPKGLRLKKPTLEDRIASGLLLKKD